MPNDSFLEQWARGMTNQPAVMMRQTMSVAAEVIFFLIDVSGSMATQCGHTDRLEAAKRAMLRMLDKRMERGVNDEVLVIAFNDRANIVVPLSHYRENREKVWRAVKALGAKGGTDLKAPLVLAQARQPLSGRVHMVLLSDGHGGNPIRAARALKDTGVVLETVGVGSDPSEVDEELLKKTASVLDGKVLYRFVTDGEAMEEYFESEIAFRLAKRG